MNILAAIWEWSLTIHLSEPQCKMIAPLFVKLSEKEEFANIIFLKVDVDKLEASCVNFGICLIVCALPTSRYVECLCFMNCFRLKTGDNIHVLVLRCRMWLPCVASRQCPLFKYGRAEQRLIRSWVPTRPALRNWWPSMHELYAHALPMSGAINPNVCTTVHRS